MRKTLIFASLMVAGEAIYLLPFVLVRIFRPTILSVFEINNLQLGTAFSVYGVIAMVSYFVGGPIADRFSSRKLITVSLLLTAAGGLYMVFIPSLFGLSLLYGFWGISTILLFWAAFIKAIREYGGEFTQGRAFGLIEAGRGFFAAAMASVAVFLFDAFLPSGIEVDSIAGKAGAIGNIILLFSVFILLSALFIWLSIPKAARPLSSSNQQLSLRGVKEVIQRRSIWLQALILLCAYVGYKCTDYFSLFASDVFGYSDVDAAHFGSISFWARPVAALAAGLLGDRYLHSKMVCICFFLIILGSGVISSGVIAPHMEILLILTIASTSIAIYGLRGLYFALIHEAKVPLIYTGSAVGIISVVGFTPDIFMGPLMGYVLDSSPGMLGHQHLFAILAVFGVIGLGASLLFMKNSRY